MSLDAEVKVLASVVSKIDTSIEKLTELSNTISKLLAVHDARLNQLEKSDEETASDIKDVHSRITTTSREICDKLDQVEHTLETRLREHSDSSAILHNEIKKELEVKMRSVDKRIGVLETWRWIVIGAAAAVGYLVDKIIDIVS